MSFPAYPGGYPAFDKTTTDNDVEVICRGCHRLTVQISNQPIYLTFGQGDPPQYGQPEPYLPITGQLMRDFDAFKVRSYTPNAQLPAGATQAQAKLIPLV